MAIRHQPQSDKYPYASPTTPGLYVTFRAYVIELICLNVNKKIGPRFWSDKKFWGPKFRREVKGIDNVIQRLHPINTVSQTALIQIIQEHNIKSLTYKTTVDKVVKSVQQRKTDLDKQRDKLRGKPPQPIIDTEKNSTFVDTKPKNTLAKIREVENG